LPRSARPSCISRQPGAGPGGLPRFAASGSTQQAVKGRADGFWTATVPTTAMSPATSAGLLKAPMRLLIVNLASRLNRDGRDDTSAAHRARDDLVTRSECGLCSCPQSQMHAGRTALHCLVTTVIRQLHPRCRPAGPTCSATWEGVRHQAAASRATASGPVLTPSPGRRLRKRSADRPHHEKLLVVRGVGDKPSLRLKRRLQTGEQRIDRVRQRPGLVARAGEVEALACAQTASRNSQTPMRTATSSFPSVSSPIPQSPAFQRAQDGPFKKYLNNG
jgi:hypothetical protein